MEITYDVGRERLADLVPAMEDPEKGRNEATTRLHLVDRLLFDCLGWDREEAILEEYERPDYADYILERGSRRLVVEAKKEGVYFRLPDGLGRVSQVANLIKLGGDVASAIEQASGYAQARGIPYAAVCNGHQLIAFVGSRQDGVSPSEGRALVFSKPQEMLDDFSELWDLLGPRGTEARRLTRRLSAVAAAPPPKLSEQIASYPGTAPLREDAYVLTALKGLFVPDYVLRGEDGEVEFLERCYCKPGAYSQLAAFNRGLLRARYSAALGQEMKVSLEEARSKEGLNPALLEDVAATTAGRQPLVLLGDVGVGKTMFLRRMLRVEASQLAENAIALYVDLGRTAVFDQLSRYIRDSIADQLLTEYEVDIDEDSFLRGTYHKEVRRFAKGLDGPLAESAPEEFKRREIDKLRELTANVEEHLRRSFEHLVSLRKQQVVIVLDNIDQRSRRDQEAVFLIAETMASSWPCTVFVTLRPETYNASRADGGTLSGYQPRAYTIEPPRVERVIVQRLSYGLDHYDKAGCLPSWAGWTTHSDDLRLYIEVLLKSFSRSEPLQSALINLSGGNARRALELVTDLVSSPHGQPHLLLERNRDDDYLLPPHQFLKAVLLRESAHYDPESARIPNVFDVSTNDTREHFLLPCLLGLLRRAAEQRDGEGYVSMEDVYRTFQDLGFTPDQVEFATRRAQGYDLVDPLPPDGEPRALRLTTVGEYSHQQLPRSFEYIDAITVDLPIADPKVRQDLQVVRSTRQRLARSEVVLQYLAACWESACLTDTGYFALDDCIAAVRSEMERIGQRL